MAAEDPREVSLTLAQGRQLRRLLAVKALAAESGASPYDFTPDDFHGGRQLVVNAVVLGKLQRMGLTDAKLVRKGRGSQHTIYWLTQRGHAIAFSQRRIIDGAIGKVA